MAPEPSNGDSRVIAAYLDGVDHELDAAKRLVANPPSRFSYEEFKCRMRSHIPRP